MVDWSRVRGWLRRRWLAVLVPAWTLLLVLFAFGAFSGDVTIPAQRDTVAARSAVDNAARDVIRAAGSDAAVRVSGYERVADCRVTLARGGARYQRVVELYPAPGRAVALVAAVARRLPEGYRPDVWRDSFVADAEGFVQVNGVVEAEVLRVRLETGCRPDTRPVTSLRTGPNRAERERLLAVLRRLRTTHDRPEWRAETLRCVRQGSLTVADPRPRLLDAVPDLAPPEALVLARGARLLAYREGGVSVVVEIRQGRLRITATSVTC